ncbi:hypothetical protein [Bradyrhizobium sp. STM 3809]|uniref:hypothetical protein n=1 Tax=Bradyrhizobium sp. STM 3809 TaxID=551936 RepID=UPI00024081DD|nr:hypothetical protein [Bradyrhizobium sp. STM 3809]CCE03062.1 hypothetical protein BRAS3809_6900011 [Bradyrhizobium sp. STM 3809]
MTSQGFLREFISPDGAAAIVVEDDGRVAYGYWLDAKGSIGGDVWLYNRGPAPEQPEWTNREGAPYANPAAFVDEAVAFSRPSSAACLTVEWRGQGSGQIGEIFVAGVLLARLTNGSKPGWSRLAAKDGPLALRLTE